MSTQSAVTAKLWTATAGANGRTFNNLDDAIKFVRDMAREGHVNAVLESWDNGAE